MRKDSDFDYYRVRSGLIRMLFGFFKKIVIADRLSMYVKYVYENYDQVSGWTLVLGAVFFVFQVYCDFSGYSDIALGASRVIGINLMENFKRPFYANAATKDSDFYVLFSNMGFFQPVFTKPE